MPAVQVRLRRVGGVIFCVVILIIIAAVASKGSAAGQYDKCVRPVDKVENKGRRVTSFGNVGQDRNTFQPEREEVHQTGPLGQVLGVEQH